jgi:hypothetical protein
VPRPRRHRYDLHVIGRLLGLVLLAGVTLRAAARASVLLSALAHGPDRSTGRWWLLRLGLYRLRRDLDPGDDWCWLIDHTALLGRHRLLVVLGMRLRDWRVRADCGQGALQFTHVSVLRLAAVKDPNAEQVHAQLKSLADRVGPPRAIVSDHGADVLAGIQQFRRHRPGVAEIYDIKHFAANRLKGLLERQPAWVEFQSQLGKTKAALQQTEWAFVVPPALRTKSRYLNLDVLLNWAAKARALLDLPETERAQRGDVARLEKALGWLRGLTERLAQWQEWLTISEAAVRTVRENGLYVGAAQRFAQRLIEVGPTEAGRGLAQVLVEFVNQQESQAQKGERLVGSTEVLESLFGRFKALTREHSRAGVTSLALAIPALLGAPGQEELAQALAGCNTADVRSWVKENLAPNIQQQRCWLRSLLPCGKRKKNQARKVSAPP